MTILNDSSAARPPPLLPLPAADTDRPASRDTTRFAADVHGLATCSLSSMAAPSVTAMYAIASLIASIPFLFFFILPRIRCPDDGSWNFKAAAPDEAFKIQHDKA
jgi:hypothetical protein